MTNTFWNKKVRGLPGAICVFLSIICERMTNWFSTRMMLGNIKKHGKNICVMRGCKYRYPQLIELGDDVIIGHHVSLTAEICKEYDNPNMIICGRVGHFVVEQGVSIGNYCEIDYSGGVIIGKMAHIAHYVQITTHDHGYDYRNEPVGKFLEIGEGSFIGSRSMILHNCRRIGKNAVIGAGSVVTKDVPDNAVVAGNPAKIIKYREDIV